MSDVKYDANAYRQAHQKYLDGGRNLTDDDLAQLELVSPEWKRPRQLRDGSLPKLSADEVKQRQAPVTAGELEAVLRDVLTPISNSIAFLLSDARKRIAELEARPAPMNYRGVFRESDAPYIKNEIVSHQGSAWICLGPTSARPGGAGAESRAWRLFVKKGDDAPRDATR